MTDAFFVYGTLRPGGRYWPNVADFIVGYEPAFIEGFAMRHLPDGYPAIVAGEGQVFGDLLLVRERCETLVQDIVDEIEGYEQPGRDNLYLRVEVAVQPLRRLQVVARAQTYVYAPERRDYYDREGDPVVAGDWREYVATHEGIEP